MGDAESGPIRLSFNPQLRIEFRGATVTSDAGLLLPRELDKRLGLDALIEQHLTDPRSGRNRQFPLPDLFRQSIYSRLAGYEDTNDAERLVTGSEGPQAQPDSDESGRRENLIGAFVSRRPVSQVQIGAHNHRYQRCSPSRSI